MNDVSKNNARLSGERYKLLFLAVIYFLIIAAYTILRDLKNSVFMATVGKEYIPWAKVGVLFMLIPAILFYSKLVDRVRRHQLLMFYSLFYGVVTFLFSFLIGHATIGIGNTDQSPYRLFGWLFFFFVEGFTPFVLSVFWSFVNSVNKPEEAKRNYGFLVGGSKLGGMLTAGLAWALLSITYVPFFGVMSGEVKHRLMLIVVSVILLLIPLAVMMLMRTVSGHYLHGYEAVYKVEKRRSKEGTGSTGIFAGLKMFIKYPYVLGIFCMVFFYEVLTTILSYLRLHIAQSSAQSVSGVSAFLFKWVFIMQAAGFVVSFLGTTPILRKFGVRSCLLMIPAFMAIGSFFFFASSTASIIMIAYVFTKTTHYAFSYPVREQLYIPTLKEIKFKSKSWIDAFGSKFAKMNGSAVNIVASKLGAAFFLPVIGSFFVIMIGIWSVAAYFLGIRFDKAVDNNEVIGLNGHDDNEE